MSRKKFEDGQFRYILDDVSTQRDYVIGKNVTLCGDPFFFEILNSHDFAIRYETLNAFFNYDANFTRPDRLTANRRAH